MYEELITWSAVGGLTGNKTSSALTRSAMSIVNASPAGDKTSETAEDAVRTPVSKSLDNVE
jgi:hypothetical protein